MTKFLTRIVLTIIFCSITCLNFVKAAACGELPAHDQGVPITGEVVSYSAFPELPIVGNVTIVAELNAAETGSINSMMRCATMYFFGINDVPINVDEAFKYYAMAANAGYQKNIQGDLRKQCAAASLSCAAHLRCNKNFKTSHSFEYFIKLSSDLGHPTGKVCWDKLETIKKVHQPEIQCAKAAHERWCKVVFFGHCFMTLIAVKVCLPFVTCLIDNSYCVK